MPRNHQTQYLHVNGRYAAQHGMSYTPTYEIWRGMIKRCTLPSHSHWHRYGGRGIRVCERWRTFENFLADMGIKPEGYSIERINNDGNYEPANCKWIPLGDQWKNRSQGVRQNYGTRLTLNSETQSISEWARLKGLSYYALRNRLRRGWDLERAISTPAQPYRGKRK